VNDIIDQIRFDEKGLVPAVVQDYSTRQVLMVAYMNKEALQKTLETKIAHYFSRSRRKLWKKGETSGHFQYVKEIRIDCDEDTILLLVEQVGVACHTGHYSCFYREVTPQFNIVEKEEPYDVLGEVMGIVKDRKVNPKEGSYVNYLFSHPEDKLPKKIGEEATEVVIAYKDKDRPQIIYEVADLWFHTMVLLGYMDIPLFEIFQELKGRRKKR